MMTQTQPTFGSQAIMQISQFMGMDFETVREMVGAAETKAMNEQREITIAFEDGNKKEFFSVELLDEETFETNYQVTLIEEDQVEVAEEAVEEVQEDKWEDSVYETAVASERVSRKTGKARTEWQFVGWSTLPSETDENVESMTTKTTKAGKFLTVTYKNSRPSERFTLELAE